MKLILFVQFFVLLTVPSIAQSGRRVGKFQEVFAWKQITYDIEGTSGIYIFNINCLPTMAWDRIPSLARETPVFNHYSSALQVINNTAVTHTTINTAIAMCNAIPMTTEYH